MNRDGPLLLNSLWQTKQQLANEQRWTTPIQLFMANQTAASQ